MGWTRNYKGYYISYFGCIYTVRDKNYKKLFNATNIKSCKEYIKKLSKEVLDE